MKTQNDKDLRAYCVKCQAKVPLLSQELVAMTDKQKAMRGRCVCGTGLYRILPKGYDNDQCSTLRERIQADKLRTGKELGLLDADKAARPAVPAPGPCPGCGCYFGHMATCPELA